MAVFRGKPKRNFTPLELPAWGHYPIPDLRRADETLGLGLMQNVNEVIARLGPDGLQSVFPDLLLLHTELINLLVDHRDSEREAIEVEVRLPLQIGWAFGDQEAHSGIAKVGMKEATSWMSMITLWHVTQDSESKYLDEALFAMWAAYYVARTSSRSISEILRRTPGYWRQHPNESA
jgi:hypothetical protein